MQIGYQKSVDKIKIDYVIWYHTNAYDCLVAYDDSSNQISGIIDCGSHALRDYLSKTNYNDWEWPAKESDFTGDEVMTRYTDGTTEVHDVVLFESRLAFYCS